MILEVSLSNDQVIDFFLQGKINRKNWALHVDADVSLPVSGWLFKGELKLSDVNHKCTTGIIPELGILEWGIRALTPYKRANGATCSVCMKVAESTWYPKKEEKGC